MFLMFLCKKELYLRKKNCFHVKMVVLYVKTKKGKRQPVEAVMTFKIPINCEELVILVMPTQAKHPLSYTKYRTNLVTVL